MSRENFDNYISKFFQVKINIPNLDNTSLVKKYINPLLPEFGTCVGFGDEILSLLENPRDFEAVINSYKLLLLNLSENCNKYTLFQLEILRHKRYELYEYIRKSGDSLEKFSAQTFTEEILKKNDKIIISLRVGNSYNTEKLFDISYFYKYFDYIIGPNTIDQTLFNKIVLENDYSKIDSQFKQWITENKYDDLYLKIGVLIESKRFDLNCDLLIQIDKSMIFGSQNKRTILPSIFEIFCRFADRQDETFNNYIENIIKTLNSDNDTDYSRVIGYYLFDKNDSNLLINVNKFITLLIDNAYYKNNEIYWLITNYLYWKSASNTYKNMNIWKFSNVDLEKFTTKIESLIINNLKILFNIDVVSFLNNVIMPIENNPRIFSYTILFKIVPIHISTSEVLINKELK